MCGSIGWTSIHAPKGLIPIQGMCPGFRLNLRRGCAGGSQCLSSKSVSLYIFPSSLKYIYIKNFKKSEILFLNQYTDKIGIGTSASWCSAGDSVSIRTRPWKEFFSKSRQFWCPRSSVLACSSSYWKTWCEASTCTDPTSSCCLSSPLLSHTEICGTYICL